MAEGKDKPMYEVLEDGTVNVTDMDAFNDRIATLYEEGLERDRQVEESFYGVIDKLRKISDEGGGDIPIDKLLGGF